QPDGDVAAELVGAEDVLPSGGEPLRPDGCRGDELAAEDASLRDDVDLLAVHGDRVENVRVVRPGVGHVVRVERREDARDDDEDEEPEEGEGDVVPTKAPPGEVPRAPAADDRTRLLGGELRRGVEREFGFRRRLGQASPW